MPLIRTRDPNIAHRCQVAHEETTVTYASPGGDRTVTGMVRSVRLVREEEPREWEIDIVPRRAPFKFEPVGTFITDRGTVYTGPCPLDGRSDATNIRKRVGDLVEIGGVHYQVRGVETFARLTPPALGESVAILVGPPIKSAGGTMTDRYIVVDGSQSAHCCFSATVVDTTRPVMIHGKHYENQFEPICECIDYDDAQRIADAMNAVARPAPH